MSDPIAYENIDLYAKINGEEVVIAKLNLPIHADLDLEKWLKTKDLRASMSYRVGKYTVHEPEIMTDTWKASQDAIKNLTVEMETQLND